MYISVVCISRPVSVLLVSCKRCVSHGDIQAIGDIDVGAGPRRHNFVVTLTTSKVANARKVCANAFRESSIRSPNPHCLPGFRHLPEAIRCDIKVSFMAASQIALRSVLVPSNDAEGSVINCT
jgi:hypothetical protein